MRQQETIPDSIHASQMKLRFINEAFAQAKPEEHFILSAEAMTGFYCIISDIEADLEDAYNRLNEA